MQERNNTNVSAEPEVILRGMRESDAAQAAELEAACFSMPWSEQGFLEGMRSEDWQATADCIQRQTKVKSQMSRSGKTFAAEALEEC